MTTRVNLERWRAHLAAAQKRGVALAQYAREHGLSGHTLYAARKQLEREASGTRGRTKGKSSTPPNTSPFVAVRLAAADVPVLRAVSANGVALEFAQVDAALIAMLAGLPCSD